MAGYKGTLVVAAQEGTDVKTAAAMIRQMAEQPAPHDDTALLRQALDSLVWASDLTAVATSHKPLHDAIEALRARLDGAPKRPA